ncbi:MAG: hypothetical protein J7L07_05415 [Candidatus Odinarchaeota archaeon]|nr:hypothetical protein [Candidatus Odinarchaeota archaeon]
MVVFEEVSILRDLAFAFLTALITINLIFIVIFLYKWYIEPKKRFNDSRFLWSFLLIAICLQQFFFIIADFYATKENRLIWIHSGYVAVIVGLLLFIYVQEKALPFKTYNIFTIIGILSSIILFLSPREIQIFLSAAVLLPLSMAIFIMFSVYVFKVSAERDKIFLRMFINGIILFGIGEFLTSDMMTQYDSVFYVIGALSMVIGSVIVNFSILNIPSFSEIGWERKLREIYFIYGSGIPIFHIRFKEDGIEFDEKSDEILLAAGVLTALKSALKIITKSMRETAVVDQGDVKLIFGHTEDFTLIVVATEDLVIYHRKIREFIEQFTTIFGKQARKWTGDTTIFEPAKELAIKIFTS